MKKIASALIMSTVLMTSSVMGAGLKDGFDVRETKTTDISDKEWTINFSHELDSSFITTNNIYITDSENKKIDTKLEILEDKTKIKIIPLSKYQSGKEYRLYIDNTIKMLGRNIYLRRAEVMPFKFTLTNEEKHIKNIHVDYTPSISNVLVTGSYEVFRVVIDGVEAHYEGELTYSLGIAGLDREENLEIKVYDDKNTLLETINYKISEK